MKYKGPLEVVSQLEQLLKDKAVCYFSKAGNIDSAVECKKLGVMMPPDLYAFEVRLFYDRRDNMGEVKVRDRDMWRLCKICPEVLKLLAGLEVIKEIPAPTKKHVEVSIFKHVIEFNMFKEGR